MKCFIKSLVLISLVMCFTTAFSSTKRVALIGRANAPLSVKGRATPLAKADTTWEVLLNPTPAYNSTSMYSFGFEHGEGTGIHGWGGSSGGWVSVVFDLSAYAEDTVKIRWAFASDPAGCTQDDPGLFGVLVDEIDIAGVFTNDGEDTTGFTWSSLVPVGGDWWHITEDMGCPSPDSAAWCGDGATGTYAPNLENVFISPLITLPVADSILGDFWHRGKLGDSDSFPDCDYMRVELSPDSGRHWYAISNPTGDTLGKNYVYPFSEDMPWTIFHEAWESNPYINVSMYAGKSVQFRIGVHSDGDTPDGEGLFIDDFFLYTEGASVDTFYHEDFESGASGWVSVDLTDVPGVWYPDTFNAYGGNGKSWWMGNPEIGGYLDHWYQVLDSPEIGLPAGTCSLKFVMNRAIEALGSGHPSGYNGWDGFNVRISVLWSGVEEECSETIGFKLYQTLPNPAVNKTLIRFSVSKLSDISLRIYNLSGQLVRTLVNEPMDAGIKSIMWDTRNSDGLLVPGGIYFYELKAGELKETKKLILLR